MERAELRLKASDLPVNSSKVKSDQKSLTRSNPMEEGLLGGDTIKKCAIEQYGDLENNVLQVWTKLIDSSRDHFTHLHPNIAARNLRFKVSFERGRKYPARYSINSGLPKEHKNWSLECLQYCYSELLAEMVKVEVYAIHPSPLNLTAPKRHDSDISKTALCEYVKTRLRATIEAMIGRPLTATNGAQINLLKDDPEDPNLFKWVHNKKYSFPANVLSKFEKSDLFDLIEALEHGNLWVRSLRTEPLDPKEMGPLQEISEIAQQGVDTLISEAQLGLLQLIYKATGKKERVEDLPEILDQTSIIMKHWEWKFTPKYPQFHMTGKPDGARNHPRFWKSRPLVQLLLAMKLRRLSLIARMSQNEAQNFVPRKASSHTKTKLTYRACSEDEEREKSPSVETDSQSSYDSTYADHTYHDLGCETIQVDIRGEEDIDSPERFATTQTQTHSRVTMAGVLPPVQTPSIDILAMLKQVDYLVRNFLEESTRALEQKLASMEEENGRQKETIFRLEEAEQRSSNLPEEENELREIISRLESRSENDQGVIKCLLQRHAELEREVVYLKRYNRKLEIGEQDQSDTPSYHTKRQQLSYSTTPAPVESGQPQILRSLSNLPSDPTYPTQHHAISSVESQTNKNTSPNDTLGESLHSKIERKRRIDHEIDEREVNVKRKNSGGLS